MKNTKVSVIIPNYNHAPYLDARIQSVLNQTYQDFELIILDDCSTDNSKEVIEKYRSDSHLTQIVYNEHNCGKVFTQWKRGIELAQGDLIWIAESDDVSDLDFLETLVNKFEDYPSLSLAFCKSWMFDNEGNKWKANQDNVSEGFFEGKSFITEVMSSSCIMYNASSCLFRKSVFFEIDDIYTTFRASGDYMFWTLICEHGDVYVVDERMNHYRKHGMNVTDKGFLLGINQKESKRVIYYIFKKEYITKQKYNEIRKDFLRRFVFEFLTDKKLKREIYSYWDFSILRQWQLRIESWGRTLYGYIK